MFKTKQKLTAIAFGTALIGSMTMISPANAGDAYHKDTRAKATATSAYGVDVDAGIEREPVQKYDYNNRERANFNAAYDADVDVDQERTARAIHDKNSMKKSDNRRSVYVKEIGSYVIIDDEENQVESSSVINNTTSESYNVVVQENNDGSDTVAVVRTDAYGENEGVIIVQ